jgi:hypothetical protein
VTTLTVRRMRWRTRRWGRTWIWGVRSGEWWIGARSNFQADVTEFNLFGLTLLVGRREFPAPR